MAEKNMNAKISVEFEETANRQQLSSGDNLPTLFGKIKKIPEKENKKPGHIPGKHLTTVPICGKLELHIVDNRRNSEITPVWAL